MTRLVLRSPRVDASRLGALAYGLIVASLIIAFLILGREIIEPLVIAALLAFILSPLIRRLRHWGVWRVPSVVLTVLFALALLGALGAVIALQITQLAEDLPTYETNLRTKIRALGGGKLTSGALERASGTLKDLQEEITKASPATSPPGQRPVLVEVRQPEPRGLESIANLVRPLLSPLAMTALVVLFLIFILLQREDIRDRFLRLAGTADLQRSTAALDDAGSRLSRFFLTQTLLNAGFGVFIAIGLWLIGVPNAVLWGIFAGLMRFVPFIGGIIAAFFPILLAAAVDPGWTMVLATAGLFLVAEPIAGHVIEPLLYGQHTGLSPVAIVISTLFWTLLWGPIGLLLATPLTVCLVVLGRHIEALQFIEVLLGDEPALEPHERFYQRLLAGDDTEAADMAEAELKKKSLSAYYDAVAMPALALAQTDAAHGKLSQEKQLEICDTVEEVVEDLSDYEDKDPESGAEPRGPDPNLARQALKAVRGRIIRSFASPAAAHSTRPHQPCLHNCWKSTACLRACSRSPTSPPRDPSRSTRPTLRWCASPTSAAPAIPPTCGISFAAYVASCRTRDFLLGFGCCWGRTKKPRSGEPPSALTWSRRPSHKLWRFARVRSSSRQSRSPD